MKKFLATVLTLLFCISLFGCGGIKESEISGHTWGGTMELDGTKIYREMTFAADGTFTGVFTDNEEKTEITGTWKLVDGVLQVQETGALGYQEYTYMGGKLKNGTEITISKIN